MHRPDNTATGAVYPNCPDKLFQYHHQPLNYYESFAPGTQMRARHLRDEEELEGLIAGSRKSCKLKPVSLHQADRRRERAPRLRVRARRAPTTWWTC